MEMQHLKCCICWLYKRPQNYLIPLWQFAEPPQRTVTVNCKLRQKMSIKVSKHQNGELWTTKAIWRTTRNTIDLKYKYCTCISFGDAMRRSDAWLNSIYKTLCHLLYSNPMIEEEEICPTLKRSVITWVINGGSSQEPLWANCLKMVSGNLDLCVTVIGLRA